MSSTRHTPIRHRRSALPLESTVLRAVEALERRTLLSGTIAGALYLDTDRDGVLGAADGPGSGIIYVDLDGDAARGISEPSLSTSPTGTFDFTDLPAGTYTVRLGQTNLHVQTFPTGRAGLKGTVADGQRVNVGTFLYNSEWPDGVTNLSAIPVSDAAAVELSWVEPQYGVVGYQVQRATGATGAFVVVGTGGRNARLFTDTTVAPDTVYRYRVRADYGSDVSDWSSAVAVTTLPPNVSNPIRSLPQLTPVSNAVSADPTAVVTAGGVGYFAATDPQHGWELWRTDGTESGTTIVTDLVAGTGSSNPQHLTDVNGVLFFSVNLHDSTALYRTDGTDTGTVKLADLSRFEGSNSPVISHVRSVAVMGGELYLAAIERFQDVYLWRSDGTVVGTTRVAATPGAEALTALGNRVLFRATAQADDWEPWVSDGTAGGTGVLKDVVAGSTGSSPTNFAVMNGRAYFGAGTGLWSTNGTTTGTTFVKNALPVAKGDGGFDAEFAVAGNTLFFPSFTFATGVEMWKSDGTAAGTTMVTEVYPGPGRNNPTPALPHVLAAIGTKVVFTADWLETYQETVDGVPGTYEHNISSLWVTDGTAAGTIKIARISPDYRDYGTKYLVSATVVNGTLYYSKLLENGTGELWKSNLTTAGTVKVASLAKAPFNLSSFNGLCTFAGDDGQSKAQLWSSDGAAAGTKLLKLIGVAPKPARPDWLTNVNGTVFFTSSDGISGPPNDHVSDGRELWKTDGTTAGTTRVLTGRASELAAVGGKLVFSSFAPATGYELWVTDGTTAGTKLLVDLRAGSASSEPRLLGSLGGVAYYVVKTSQPDLRAVYRTDGTAAGTTIVFSNYLLDDAGAITSPGVASNGAFYFAPPASETGGQLYRVGATGVATAVAGFSGLQYSPAYNLTDASGTLYFFGRASTDTTSPGGLWKVAGPTASATRAAQNFSGRSALLGDTTAVGNKVFFVTARQGSSGPLSQLWVSDGSAGGTRAVIDLPSNSTYRLPLAASAFNGAFYFLWAPTSGFEPDTILYRSDGTNTGTTVIKSGLANNRAVRPYFANATGSLLFVADGQHLLKTDGTPAGTSRVSRLTEPFGFGSFAGAAALTVGDDLFYSAERPDGSRELRVIAGSPPVAPTAPSLTTPAALAAPVLLAVTAGGARVAWSDAADNESGYRVERAAAGDPNGPAQQTFYLPAGATALVDPAGSATGNAYRIRAYNAAGTSAALVAGPTTQPGVISEATVDNRQAVTSGTWIASAKVTGYYGVDFLHDGGANKGALTAKFTATLTAGRQYDVYGWWPAKSDRPANVPFAITYASGAKATVLANQQINGSKWNLLGRYTFDATGSVTVSNGGTVGYLVADAVRFVLVANSLPPAPSGFSARPVSRSSIDLAWTDVAGETGYTLQRSTTSDFAVVTQTALPAGTSASVATGLTANTTYYFRIRATSASGNGPWSPIVSAKTSTAVEIVLDNTSVGVTKSAGWTASTYNAGFLGTNYLHDGGTKDGAKWVRYTPALPAAGKYQVWARWTTWPDHATNAPFEIARAGGTTTVKVNQRAGVSGAWVLLGTFDFLATGASVTLRNAGVDGHVIADGVKFVGA